MEQRKLIQQGPSSLSITLPNKWIKENNLARSDSIYINEENNEITLSTDKKEKNESTKINIDELDKVTALHYMQSKYRMGFDEIKIIHNEKMILKYPENSKSLTTSLIHNMSNRFVGLEIVEQTKEFSILKRIITDNAQKFDQVLRRIFLLTKVVAEELVEGIESRDVNLFQMVKDKHDSINNLSNYCLRIISNGELKNFKASIQYYHLIAQIEKLIDILKYVAIDNDKFKKKPSKKYLEILKEIQNSIITYYEFFYKFNKKQAHVLNKNRWTIKYKIMESFKELSKEEIHNITRMEGITEILLDITETRMSLEK